MKLGILQGRLSPPVNGLIQEFPFVGWKTEFREMAKLGLTHIEWIVTKSSYGDNPLFLENVSNLNINTICCDHLIHEKIENLSFLRHNLMEVCDRALLNNIKSVTIPLLEESSMEDSSRRKLFIRNIVEITKEYPSLLILFEPELHSEGILEIVESNENFFVTYDTGNITSYNNEHEKFITTLFHKIQNVHLKDRKNGKTVLPFNGDTNFNHIFRLLKQRNYSGDFTLQVARSICGGEYKYIEDVKKHFVTYYESI